MPALPIVGYIENARIHLFPEQAWRLVGARGVMTAAQRERHGEQIRRQLAAKAAKPDPAIERRKRAEELARKLLARRHAGQ
jgi:hypothetical protein